MMDKKGSFLTVSLPADWNQTLSEKRGRSLVKTARAGKRLPIHCQLSRRLEPGTAKSKAALS